MPVIRLEEADRERLGAPEWLPFDSTTVLMTEAEAYEDAGGDVGNFLDRRSIKWWRAMVWVSLHRIGVAIKVDECDFNLVKVQIEDHQPGKAPGSESADEPTP